MLFQHFIMQISFHSNRFIYPDFKLVKVSKSERQKSLSLKNKRLQFSPAVSFFVHLNYLLLYYDNS